MAFSHSLPDGIAYTILGIDPRDGVEQYRIVLYENTTSELSASILADPNILIVKRKTVKSKDKWDSHIFEIQKRIGEVL